MFYFIQPWFQIIRDFLDFKELDYIFVIKIEESHELYTDSELQTLEVAKSWLQHEAIERSQYVGDVSLKTRLWLLSGADLRHVVEKELSCVEDSVLKSIVAGKQTRSLP